MQDCWQQYLKGKFKAKPLFNGLLASHDKGPCFKKSNHIRVEHAWKLPDKKWMAENTPYRKWRFGNTYLFQSWPFWVSMLNFRGVSTQKMAAWTLNAVKWRESSAVTWWEFHRLLGSLEDHPRNCTCLGSPSPQMNHWNKPWHDPPMAKTCWK